MLFFRRKESIVGSLYPMSERSVSGGGAGQYPEFLLDREDYDEGRRIAPGRDVLFDSITIINPITWECLDVYEWTT